MVLYDYQAIFKDFDNILYGNKERAYLKRQEYLQKIMMIFTQFVKKCQKQIDCIINKKIQKLQNNYSKVKSYFIQQQNELSIQKKYLIIAQFLIKPFQRFPFAGNKNQKLFKQQYNLIEKASVLIEQTLVDSFNEDEVPTFQNQKFFKTLNNYGLGNQSLTKLRINPQNFVIQPIEDLIPYQKNVKSLKILSNNLLFLVGQSRSIQIWDLQQMICIKKFYSQNNAEISCLNVIQMKVNFLVLGYKDQNPQIWCYRMDNWSRYGCSVVHTRQITKLLQYQDFLISGSIDGNICIHSMIPFKTIHQSPHISSIQDIIIKNTYIYILLKCSTVCQYQVQKNQNIQNGNDITLQFRRTLSAGYISIIRFPEVTSNFTGVACHIYGLSQIQITRKFKIEEVNIINVVQMISDFIILQSKETSQFFAICCFQNSSAIRIYSLLSQQLIYQLASDYSGEVGVAGYLPKIQISYLNGNYILALVVQSQFSEEKSTIKLFKFKC